MQVALPSSTASSGDQFLLPTLQQLFSGIVSYLVIDTIVQANAVGYILGLKDDSNITSEDHGLPSKVESLCQTYRCHGIHSHEKDME
jgi:hypothetical protein